MVAPSARPRGTIVTLWRRRLSGECRHDGVARLVVGGDPRSSSSILRGASGARADLVARLLEVVMLDSSRLSSTAMMAASLTMAARSAPEKPGVPRASDCRSTSSLSFTLRVDLEDRLASARSGSRSTTSRSKRPGRSSAGSSTSGRLVAATTMMPSSVLEAVHLDEDRVQGLLALVVAAAHAAAATAADGVDLVEEDDAGRVLARLLEEVAHAAGADADEHLDEVGARDREEGHLGLAGDGLGEQRLAAAGRADEQHAARDAAADAREASGVLEELDDLAHLVLGLLGAGDVVEGDVGVALLRVQLRARAAERHHAAGTTLAAHLAHEQHEHGEDQDPRTVGQQHERETTRRGGPCTVPPVGSQVEGPTA